MRAPRGAGPVHQRRVQQPADYPREASVLLPTASSIGQPDEANNVPHLKRAVICLAGLAAACGSDGNNLTAPNAPPAAAFGSSCADLWTFGDGEESDAPAPAHAYASAGEYQVQLGVTDDRGATSIARKEIHVTAPVPVGPAIALSHRILSFCYHPGTTRNCVVLTRDFRITSIGGHALNWTASSDQPWIAVSPASGGTPADVRVSIDLAKVQLRNSLSVSGSITVSAAGASNSPQMLPVKLYFYAVSLP
jgi:PKD domain-containing protein/BACON domain-containing protein